MSQRVRMVYLGAGDWGVEKGRIQVFRWPTPGAALELVQEFPAGGIAAFMARSPDGRVLYVADEGKASIASYAIDPKDGTLELRSQVACAGNPVYVAAHKSGRSVFTCFFNENQTQVFAVNADGTLGASQGV